MPKEGILNKICVLSWSEVSTWCAASLERVGESHADLSHAVALKQHVARDLLPALQSGLR